MITPSGLVLLPAIVCWLLAAALPCEAQTGAKPVRPVPRAEPDAADEPVEPVLTEETLPNEVGEWDLRISVEYPPGPLVLTLPGLQLFFGITERLGGEVELPLLAARPGVARYGLGKAGASVKWLLGPAEPGRTAFVLGMEVELPTGDTAVAEGGKATEIAPFVAVLHQVGPITIQGNVPFAVEFEDGQTRRAIGYNWSAGVPLRAPAWHLLLELNGRTSFDGEPAEAAVAPGIHHALGTRTYAALAVPLGLTAATPDWRLVVQCQLGW
jgi:hypothetical protein